MTVKTIGYPVQQAPLQQQKAAPQELKGRVAAQTRASLEALVISPAEDKVSPKLANSLTASRGALGGVRELTKAEQIATRTARRVLASEFPERSFSNLDGISSAKVLLG